MKDSVENLGRTTPDVYASNSTSIYEAACKLTDHLRRKPGLITFAKKNFAELDELIFAFEQKIFNENDVGENNNVEETLIDLSLLNDAYCAWETELEERFVLDVVHGVTTDRSDYRLHARFQRLIARELSMVDPHNIQRTLFIGSGPMPISASLIAENLGLRVDCIDICKHAIFISKILSEIMPLQSMINPICEPSSQYSVKEYDLIVIALLAKPKGEILKNILSSMKEDAKIICRTSYNFRKLVYEPLSGLEIFKTI